MFVTAAVAVVVAVLLGLAIRHFLKLSTTGGYRTMEITWKEFLVVSIVMTFVFTPLIMLAGKKLSVDNIVTYEQWLNGTEKQPIDDVTTCYGGHSGNSESSGRSNCRYTYVSDRYSYTEYYTETECTTGSDGKEDCRPVLKSREEWANVYTPYATREHVYVIPTTFGFMDGPTYKFPGVYIDSEPVPYSGEPIPGNIPRGAPQDWLDAKRHWDSNDPRWLTGLYKYPNFILASEDEVLKAFSAHVDRYKNAGLLPEPTANLMSDPMVGAKRFQANKVAFAGVSVPDPDSWQRAVMRYNTALGMKLQGDLHVVLVNSAKVDATEAVTYANAYKAYAQGPDFGKRALAKNAIVLFLGVSAGSKTIEWAEITTGMPFGNELMAQYVRDYLPGTALDPNAIFGTPRTTYDGTGAHVTLSSPRGALESIMFEKAPFARASMSCEDKNENCVGFKDLLDTIEPTATQKFFMILVTAIIALVLWFVVANGSFFDPAGSARKYRYSPY